MKVDTVIFWIYDTGFYKRAIYKTRLLKQKKSRSCLPCKKDTLLTQKIKNIFLLKA